MNPTLRFFVGITVAFILVAFGAIVGDALTFKIGAMVPFKGWNVGEQIAGAVPLAVERINNATTILGPGNTLTWVHRDSECAAGPALARAFDLLTNQNVSAFVGPMCSIACEPTALLGAYFNIPQVTPTCSSDSLTNKDIYPDLVRLTGADTTHELWLHTMNHFGWTKCAVLTSTEPIYNLPGGRYLDYLRANGIEVPVFGTFAPGTRSTQPGTRRDLLQQIKDAGIKIVIIFGYGGDNRDIMLTASDMGMLSGYAWASRAFEPTYYSGADDWMGDDGRDQEALAAMEGIFSINFYRPDTKPEYRQLQRDIATYEARYFNFTPTPEEIVFQGAILYDSVFLYAHAIAHVMANGGDPYDGLQVVAAAREVSFIGMTGTIKLTETGDFAQDSSILSFRNTALTQITSYVKDATGIARFKFLVAPAVWPGGETEQPIDSDPILVYTPIESARLALLIPTVFMISCCGALAVGIFITRRTPIWRISSWTQMIVILVGSICVYLYIPLNYMRPTNAFCTSQVWLGHVGFLLVVGSLFLKNYRLGAIFQSKTLKSKAIKDWKLYLYHAALIAAPIIYMIVLSSIDAPHAEEVSISTTVVYSRCTTTNPWWQYPLYAYESLLLLWSVYICWSIRNLHSDWNESKYIAFSIYNIVILSVVTVPVTNAFYNDPDAAFLISAGGIFLVVTVTVCVIFIPKLMLLRATIEQFSESARQTISGGHSLQVHYGASKVVNASTQVGSAYGSSSKLSSEANKTSSS